MMKTLFINCLSFFVKFDNLNCIITLTPVLKLSHFAAMKQNAVSPFFFKICI